MQSEVGIGMGLGVVGDFGKPGARHHDAGGGDSAGVERLKAGRIDRVRDREIVGMQDKQLRSGRIAQPFCGGLGLSRKVRDHKSRYNRR